MTTRPYGFIYTTYLPDGRYYKGQHKIISHSTLDPTYFGSGVILSSYISSHGTTSLKRKINAFAMSGEELNLLETAHITPQDLNNPLCMNIDTGGKHLYDSRTDDVKRRIGVAISNARKRNPDNWKSRTGKENNKSKEWQLISPDGVVYHTIGNIDKLCKDVGISPSTIKRAVKEGWTPNRGLCAGWKCYNLTDNIGTTRDTLNHGLARSGVNNPSHKAKVKRQHKQNLEDNTNE